jgi:hypothetical protein
MTRTTDDLNPERFQPLGPKVAPPPPRAPQPKQIAPGIVRNPDGRLHTNLPLPKG